MKTKRFLSILLSLVLVLGMLPGMGLTAFADDNTTTITPGSDDAKTGTGTMTITLKIKDAQTISASDVTATYGDTDKSVSASVTTPSTGGGAISYAVKTGSEDYIGVDASTGALTIKAVPPTDGKAYVIVTAAETDDYAEATKEVVVTISPATPVITLSDFPETYDGSPKKLISSVAYSGTEDLYLKMSCMTAAANDIDWTKYTGPSDLTNVFAPTNAGIYYVYYFVGTPENWEVGTFVGQTSIDKARPKSDNFTFTAPSSLNYDGTAKTATVTIKDGVTGMGEVTVRYYSDEDRYNEVAECKNAGTYYVGIDVDNGKNYNSDERLYDDSWKFTIAKADPTANAPTGLTATYGQTLADVSLENANPSGNTPGTWAWVAEDTTSVGNAGSQTFTANFTPTDGDNYNSKNNVDVTITVNKASNPATVTNTATVMRGGNTVDLSSNVALNGATGVVSYQISGDAKGCTVDGNGVLTSGTGTGTVTVNVTVATDANYEALAATPITVTINDKQTQTITAADVTANYGDTDKKVSATTNGNGAISYAVKDGSGEYIEVNSSTGALTIKKVGTATVIVTAAETSTYAQATKEVTVTISKANAVAATVTANNRTYDGTEKPLVTVTGTPTGGTMYYALGTNATTAPADNLYTTSIPTKTDAGTYYVYYKVKGDVSHFDSQESSVEVKINKAAPDYTAPEDLTAECGTKVGGIELPEGFAWNSPDSVVMNIGDNEAVLTYTPADTDNYLIVDDIIVKVKGIGIHHAKISETCEDNGVAEYWEDGAGNKFSDENGKNALTDEQTVIEKLGHNFIHFIKWVWDGFNHAIAWLFCDNDPEHIETIDVPSHIDTVDEPTCTEDGYNYYVATIDVAGKTYTTVNVETVDQLGHKWKESEWNIDGTKASLTLVCENDPSHTKTVDAAVGVTVNEEGTLRTYTAKVTVDGVEYTKTWTEDITPDVPTPDVPTPDVPTPDVPTPDVPTPDKPTPDEPTPDKPTPDEPTPDKPTPDEPTPAKEIKGILGDVNNDGQVDSADALLILRNSVGLETFDDTQRFLGDVNEDNENIDSSDALAVLRYSIGLIDIEKIGTPVSKTAA